MTSYLDHRIWLDAAYTAAVNAEPDRLAAGVLYTLLSLAGLCAARGAARGAAAAARWAFSGKPVSAQCRALLDAVSRAECVGGSGDLTHFAAGPLRLCVRADGATVWMRVDGVDALDALAGGVLSARERRLARAAAAARLAAHRAERAEADRRLVLAALDDVSKGKDSPATTTAACAGARLSHPANEDLMRVYQRMLAEGKIPPPPAVDEEHARRIDQLLGRSVVTTAGPAGGEVDLPGPDRNNANPVAAAYLGAAKKARA